MASRNQSSCSSSHTCTPASSKRYSYEPGTRLSQSEGLFLAYSVIFIYNWSVTKSWHGVAVSFFTKSTSGINISASGLNHLFTINATGVKFATLYINFFLFTSINYIAL